MTTCDVPQCDRERIMSWRPVGHGRGFRVCRHHADRDHDRHDPFDLYDVFALPRIQAEANRKRSEAAKEQHKVSNPRVGESLVVRQSVAEPERHPGQQAKAAAAKVNMGAVARGDKLAKERPKPTGPRTCECGTPLAKGKRYCEKCRAERRRATMRTYMQPYMRARRRGPVESATSRQRHSKAAERPVARRKEAEPPIRRILAETQTSVLTRGT
jgi:hypothetical protein